MDVVLPHHLPLQGEDGESVDHGMIEPELLFGSQGWCETEQPAHKCACVLDGLAGTLCETVCTYRTFAEDNYTQWPDWVYRSEPALHEMLLHSAHRTLDPEQADFFYVPVYTSWADTPWFGPAGQTSDGGPGDLLDSIDSILPSALHVAGALEPGMER
ncbi:hypothetical protein WJX84_000344 [Apatococcus fuscideae]|uniref:Uncharacterized protein n=1 Tax=Apatococcus fuscideae TaxID=2026836 RepID=A0AAW1SUF0_9CHLO